MVVVPQPKTPSKGYKHRAFPAILAKTVPSRSLASQAEPGVASVSGDRRPKAAIIGCLAGLSLVFTVLAGLALGDRHSAVTVLVGVVAIVGWGATATSMSPMLQSAAMRHSPEDPDGASGLYVAAFQVGIMAGSLLGGLLFSHGGLALMLSASALLIGSALVCVIVDRRLLVEFGTVGNK